MIANWEQGSNSRMPTFSGLPLQVIISDRHYASDQLLEVIERKTQEKILVPKEDILARIKEKLQCRI